MIKKPKKIILLLRQITILSIIFLMLIFLLSFKRIHKPGKSILIASEKSGYKNQLVKLLTEELKKENIYIEVIDDLSLLRDIKINDWKSIIIINAIRARRLYWDVENFIEDNNMDNKIVLINTSKSGKFKTDHNIDAITAASDINQIDKVKDMILDRVK